MDEQLYICRAVKNGYKCSSSKCSHMKPHRHKSSCNVAMCNRADSGAICVPIEAAELKLSSPFRLSVEE